MIIERKLIATFTSCGELEKAMVEVEDEDEDGSDKVT